MTSLSYVSDEYSKLLYDNGIDPEVAGLGTLCQRGHNWNDTGLSLRRRHTARLERCIDCDKKSTSRQGSNVGERLKTLEKRFYDNIDIKGENECWNWRSGTNKKGYGRFNLGRHGVRIGFENNTVILAHRLSYLLSNGELDPELMVLHSCDNRLCCNSNHLRQGTAADNSLDMYKRDRSQHGESHAHSKATEEVVISMRVLRWVHNWSCTAIAERYDMNSATVSEITRGILWERADGPVCESDAINWMNYDAA